MFYDIVHILKNIFHVKNPTFRDTQSDQDPDPDGSAMVLATWIRIRNETYAYPKHYCLLRKKVQVYQKKRFAKPTQPIEIEGSVCQKYYV